MPLDFPLAASDFMDLLPVQNVEFHLVQQSVHNGLASGEILSAEVAPAYWSGSVSLAPMPQRRAAVIESRLEMLQAPGRKFLAYKRTQFGPALDPKCEILADATPAIHSGDLAEQTLRLSGLPVGYEISAGDFLSFEYGAAPVRYAMHRCVEGSIAAASGNSGSFQVSPPVRPGASVGDPVRLFKPQFLAVVVPGSVSPGAVSGGIVSGVAFDFRQSIS